MDSKRNNSPAGSEDEEDWSAVVINRSPASAYSTAPASTCGSPRSSRSTSLASSCSNPDPRPFSSRRSHHRRGEDPIERARRNVAKNVAILEEAKKSGYVCPGFDLGFNPDCLDQPMANFFEFNTKPLPHIPAKPERAITTQFNKMEKKERDRKKKEEAEKNTPEAVQEREFGYVEKYRRQFQNQIDNTKFS